MSGNGRGRSRMEPHSLPPCEAAVFRKPERSRHWAAMHKGRNRNRLVFPRAGSKQLSILASLAASRTLTIAQTVPEHGIRRYSRCPSYESNHWPERP